MKTVQGRLSAASSSRPFSDALRSWPDGPGEYRARLSGDWVVGGGKIHGGFMLAVVTRAALAELVEQRGSPGLDPLAVSADSCAHPSRVRCGSVPRW